MIEIILFQLLRASVFLAVGFPVVWLLIRCGRFRSAPGQRIAWGSLLAMSLLCMTVPLRIPVPFDPIETATETVDPIPEGPLNYVQPAEDFTQESVIVADSPVANHVVVTDEPGSGGDSVATVSAKTFGEADLMVAFAGIWLTGLTVLFGRRVFAHVSLLKLLRQSPPVDDTQWSALLREHGIPARKIPLRLTESAGPALVRGPLLRLSLIVPKPLWEEITPVLRQGILRHELGHYRHGDTLLSPMLFFLAALQWFNPLAWLVLQRYDEATEWHADQFAYGTRESGSSELAETFLAIHRSTDSIGLYLNSFSRFGTLDRVNRLLPDGGKEHFMKKIVIGTVLALLLGGGLFRVQLVAEQKISDDTTTHRFFVKDKDGKPIAGAKLIVQLLPERKEPWHVKTGDPIAEFRLTTGADGGGDFTVTKEQANLPGLVLHAVAAHPDYISTGFWHNNYQKFIELQKTLKENQRWSIELEPSLPASGTVVTPDGKPAADVLVFAFSQDDRYINGAKTTTRTDKDGKFRIGMLPSENRWLWILPNDFAPLSLSLKKDESELGTLRLQQGVVLEGRFLDNGKPVENIWVSVLPKNTPAVKAQGHDAACRDAVTDKDGRFRLHPLMPGEYVMTTGMLMEYGRYHKTTAPEDAYVNLSSTELWLGKPVPRSELPPKNMDVPFAETTITLTDGPRQSVTFSSLNTVNLMIRPVGNLLQGRDGLSWIVTGRLLESNSFIKKDASTDLTRLAFPEGLQNARLMLSDDKANRYYPLRYRRSGEEKWSNNWYVMLGDVQGAVTLEVEPYEPGLLRVACRKPDGTPLEHNSIKAVYKNVDFKDPVTIGSDGREVHTGIERHSPQVEFAVMDGKTVMWHYLPVLAEEEFTLEAAGFDDESWFEPVFQTLRLKSGETRELIVPLKKRVEKKEKTKTADANVLWITVLDDETGKPMAGVAATLKYPVKGEEKPKSITTKSDDQGRVFLPRPADMDLAVSDKPRLCSLELEREKYVPVTRSLLPKYVDEELEKRNFVFVDARLVHATRLTGRLVSEDGRPVPEARIMVCRERQYDDPPHRNIASQTITGNENGTFSVAVGKRESANLQIRAKNFALKRFFVKEAEDRRDEIALGDVVMNTGFRPTVTVQDKDGRPVADTWVNLSLVCTDAEELEIKEKKAGSDRGFSMSDGGITALTDLQGIASFEPIEAGAYFIGVVETPGWPYRENRWSLKSDELFKPIKGVFENLAVRLSPTSREATVKAVKPRRVEVRFSDKTTSADRENQIWIEGIGTVRSNHSSSRYTGKYQGDGVFVFEVPDRLHDAKLVLKESATRGYRIENETSYRCRIDGKEVFPPGYIPEFPLHPLDADKVVELTCYKSPKIVLKVVDEDGKPVEEFYAGAQYTRRGQTITFEQTDRFLTPKGYGQASKLHWGYASRKHPGPRLGMDVDFTWSDSAAENEQVNCDGILPDEDLRLYVAAKGYQVVEQAIPKPAEGENLELIVSLKERIEKKPETSENVTITVLDTDNRPVADAEVFPGVPGTQIIVTNGEVDRSFPNRNVVKTDKDGRATFPAPKERYELVVVHPDGVAWEFREPNDPPKTVTLEKWARIEGVLKIGDPNDPGSRIVETRETKRKSIMETNNIDGFRNRAYIEFKGFRTAGADGKFTFDKVLPGDVTVGRRVVIAMSGTSYSHTLSHSELHHVKPGETKTIEIGAGGRTVTGKLSVPADSGIVPDWNFAVVRLNPIRSGPRMPLPPEEIRNMVPEHIRNEQDRLKAMKWREEWEKTEKGREYREKLMEFLVQAERAMTVEGHHRPGTGGVVGRVAADGTFRLEAVPPGNGKLYITLEDGTKDSKQTARLDREIEIPDGKAGEPFDLGELVPEPVEKQ